MRPIPHILQNSKTIAVVGLSDKPERPGHGVARGQTAAALAAAAGPDVVMDHCIRIEHAAVRR